MLVEESETMEQEKYTQASEHKSSSIEGILNQDISPIAHDWSSQFTFTTNSGREGTAEIQTQGRVKTTTGLSEDAERIKFTKMRERLNNIGIATSFHLQKQPNQFQRKCYANENRYLLPHPLVILCNSDSVQWWSVQALLGDGKWELLEHYADDTRSTHHYLVEWSGLKKMNRSIDSMCEFSLRVSLQPSQGMIDRMQLLSNSSNRIFTLIFYVKYKLVGGDIVRQKILSEPFELQSNKLFVGAEPQLESLSPWRGYHRESTEVTIKGRDFARKVTAELDGSPVEVLRVASTFVILRIPPMPTLHTTTTMHLRIINHFTKRQVTSRETLQYTFVVS
ncbi:hypothetical protein PROFUN_15619 [Planoprotostelium fungivorum]|uniref:IPT/TIG domain-containing protein n=1 Tax=Planoprotostelium fungivorum TaxID=1890364 RepID=A0A2P6MVH6_9EUKA|nr:hypothetical protein PROFUN_15619 [Planoprotostelium fungivorum]